MPLSDPLLDATSVENVFIVADQCSYHLVLLKLTPTDRTLLHQALFFLALLVCLSLLFFVSRSVKRRYNLWHRQRHAEDSAKHAVLE